MVPEPVVLVYFLCCYSLFLTGCKHEYRGADAGEQPDGPARSALPLFMETNNSPPR